MEKTNEKSLDILYNLCIKNNLFVRAYKLYPKYRREEDMTDNGKPKYFSLMEQLRSMALDEIPEIMKHEDDYKTID